MRELHVIAQEIRKEWKKVHYTADPYVSAMSMLSGMNDRYISEDADSIVLRFLSNAGSFRGEAARRIKAELKEMLATQKTS